MRDLVNQTCGTQNPLVELSHQVRGDAARQQDGLGNRSRLQGPGTSRQAPNTFHMGQLLQQMNDVPGPQEQYQRWMDDFHSQNFVANSNQWSSEFASLRTAAVPALPVQTGAIPKTNRSVSAWSPAAPIHGMPSPMYAPPVSRMYSSGEQMTRPFNSLSDKKWAYDILAETDKKFAEDQSELKKVARDFVKSADDPQVQNTDFFKFVEDVGQTIKEKSEAVDNEQIRSAEADKSRDDMKFWTDLAESWSNASFNSSSNPGSTKEILPEAYRTYQFDEQSPLNETMIQNPFEEGLEKLRQGDLPSAVLLFEAAVKKNSTHIEAWQYLGTTQAQNEMDVQAIAALRQCLTLDPQNLTALMALAVSYTNEGLQRQACEAHRQWLHANPKYSHLVKDVEPQLDQNLNISIMETNAHKEIMNLYIEAAQIQPENPDADVQSGLGVLLNMSFEFDKAVDCFKAAVSVRPDDASSWNRLGASLANGGRSAEAVEAYRKALELYPGYIRARFNLGISCINLECYQEAAEHFLSALNLQDNAKGEAASNIPRNSAMSDNIWNTLRMSITLMNRPDLYEAVDSRNISKLKQIFLKE